MGSDRSAGAASHQSHVGWLEFNVPFQRKYGYIRDDPIPCEVDSYIVSTHSHRPTHNLQPQIAISAKNTSYNRDCFDIFAVLARV